MPTPMPDENRDDFLKRCIPMVLDEGTASDQEQAVAVCSSMWEHRNDKEQNKMKYSLPVKIEEFKAVGDDWMVEGYLSTFNNVDLGRDMVVPGAFSETLKSGPKVSFLLSHDPRLVLGVPKAMKEDKKGLFGSFKISRTQLGSDTRQLLLDGAIDSFSIGYEAVDYKFVDEDIRQLIKLKLYEVSLVPIPMNPEAVVTGVKTYLTLADQTKAIKVELSELLNDLRELSGKDYRPLSEAKRQELAELLETFSGLDAVRSDLSSVLTAAQPKLEPVSSRSLVSSKLISYQMNELRKKYAAPGEK